MDRNNALAREIPVETAPESQSASAPRNHLRLRQIVGISLVGVLCLSFLALLGSTLLTPAQNQAVAVSPLIGHPAPDFTLSALNAGSTSPPTMHLASLKGKPVILNFWASWCDACKREAPLLEANWSSVLQNQGVLLLGIDMQDTHAAGLNFLRTYGITYPNVVDPTGATVIDYGVSAVPETFFINRQGIIVAKVIGEVTEQSLQNNLHLILHA